MVRLDGSGLREVTSTGGIYPDPDFSPNGRKLVSSSFEFAGLPQWTLKP